MTSSSSPRSSTGRGPTDLILIIVTRLSRSSRHGRLRVRFVVYTRPTPGGTHHPATPGPLAPAIDTPMEQQRKEYINAYFIDPIDPCGTDQEGHRRTIDPACDPVSTLYAALSTLVVSSGPHSSTRRRPFDRRRAYSIPCFLNSGARRVRAPVRPRSSLGQSEGRLKNTGCPATISAPAHFASSLRSV
jgi:hypothetical protein